MAIKKLIFYISILLYGLLYDKFFGRSPMYNKYIVVEVCLFFRQFWLVYTSKIFVFLNRLTNALYFVPYICWDNLFSVVLPFQSVFFKIIMF
jgi:hypothetical protein